MTSGLGRYAGEVRARIGWGRGQDDGKKAVVSVGKGKGGSEGVGVGEGMCKRDGECCFGQGLGWQ